jgi:hypothetical protein
MARGIFQIIYLFNVFFINVNYITSKERVMTNELERIWKEAVMALF